jgi:RND superfamily putative drug exporter
VTTTFPGPAPRPPGPLARWARFAIRNPWRVIAVWVAVIVLVGIAGNRLGGEYVNQFTVPGSDSQAALDLLNDRFPDAAGDTASLVFQTPAGVTDPAARAGIDAVLDQAAQLPGVTGVTSPWDAPEQVSDDGTIAYATLQYATAAIDVPTKDAEALFALVDSSSGEAGVRVEAGGQVVSANEFPELGGTAELIGIGVALIIMVVIFGSVITSFLPIVTAIIGVALATIVMPLFANGFTLSGDVTPAFISMLGLGVGIDYALFIINRHREGLLSGRSIEDAAVTAMDTAARSVAFAGIVVAVGLLGLSTIGIPFVTGMGVAGSVAVGISVLVAIFLMPAILGLLGSRVMRFRVPGLGRAPRGETGFWFRWGRAIQRRPGIVSGVAVLILVLLAIPYFSIYLNLSDAGNNPETNYDRRAYDLTAEGFGPGANGPLLLVLEDEAGLPQATLDSVTQAITAVPGVESVSAPATNEAGDTSIVQVIPVSGPQDEATTELTNTLRDDTLPAALAGTGIAAYVGGATAATIDISQIIADRTPIFFIVVIGLSMLLLALVFRSVVIPVKTALLNLLSVGAAYGATVAVFQWGWLSGPLGLGATGPIEAFLPIILFGILFGLSMDYEVFLLSRVHEEVVHHTPARRAMLMGVGYSGRVVAAAGAIMAAVFLGFFLEDNRTIKMIGFGLGFAVFVDAFLVRLILVPAVMTLLGKRAWYIPTWLDRILPRVSVEGPAEPDPSRVDPAGFPVPTEPRPQLSRQS